MASNKEKQSKRRRPRMRVILPQPHMLFRFKIPEPGEEYELLIDYDSLSASDACSETNPCHQTPKQKQKQSSSSSVTPSYFSCNLCSESERQPVVTSCGHLYCHSCLCDWLRIDRKCPVCQAQVIDGHVFPIYQCSGPRTSINTMSGAHSVK